MHKRVLKRPSRRKTAAVLIIVRNLVTVLEKAAPTKVTNGTFGSGVIVYKYDRRKTICTTETLERSPDENEEGA